MWTINIIVLACRNNSLTAPALDVRCRKTLDDSDIVDVKLYECTRTQYIESTDDNRDDMMT